MLIPVDRTAVDIVAAVEAADVGIQGSGERIVVVSHCLNGFVLKTYTTAVDYPFILVIIGHKYLVIMLYVTLPNVSLCSRNA